MARVIFHIDINAFFASAHIIEDVALKGKPVVVCRDVRGSVVTTASYEARNFGIHSAMPLSQAKKLCSDLIVVEQDFELYLELSSDFIDIIKSFSPYVEQASIDECYVDVTQAISDYKHPLDLAVAIQDAIMDELKLPISIGVGPNKFLAKMASDMKKPNGITVLRIREAQTKLWPLDISEMFGIGKMTVPKLRALGVKTIGDLNTANFDDLRLILGNRTQIFIDRSNGLDHSELEIESTAKSIGQSKTFADPIYDYAELKDAIAVEVQEVERRAMASGVLGKTVQFSLRTQEYNTAARSITLDQYISDKDDIMERVLYLYNEFEDAGGVTFISITLANLKPKEDIIQQIDIFNIPKETPLDSVIKQLNDNLNQNLFKRASALIKGVENE